MVGAASNTQNTYTIRTLDDDIKGGPGETGNFQVQTGGPPTLGTPPPGGQTTSLPGTTPPAGASPSPGMTPPPPTGGSPLGTPGSPAAPQLKGRSKLAASAMKGSKTGSKRSLFIMIGVIALLFIGGSAAYYFTQIAPMDSTRTTTTSPTTSTPSDNQDDTQNNNDDTGDDNQNDDTGTLASIKNIESIIPSSYGYYLTLKNGIQTDGKVYEFQQSLLLKNTFSEDLFTNLGVDLTDLTWNTNELFYVPKSTEVPSKTNTSPEALIALSVDRSTEAQTFIDDLKNNTYALTSSGASNTEIISIIDDNNASLFFVEFSDYIIISAEENTILSTLDLIDNESTTTPSGEKGLDTISSVTAMKVTINNAATAILTQQGQDINLNFHELSISFPSDYIDWKALNGFYLYSTENNGYVFAIDTVIQEMPDMLPAWQPNAFEDMKEMYPGVNAQGDMEFINEPYEGYFKRYVNLHEYGAATQSSLTYVIMENHMFIASTPTAFTEVTKAYLNNTSSTAPTNTDSL